MTAVLPRIVIVTDRSVARGGATGMALQTARLLRQRGREVTFISADIGGSQYLTDIGATHVGMGQTKFDNDRNLGKKIKNAKRGIWNNETIGFLSDWIEKHGRKDDIWHLHTWAQIFSPAIFKALKPVKNRLFVHAHDYFNACPNGAFFNYVEQSPCSLVPLSARCVLSNCDKRSYPQKLWRIFRQLGLGKTFTDGDMPNLLLIHPGMREDFLRSGFTDERMIDLRNPYIPFLEEPIDASQNNGLLFVGRLDEEKGGLGLARAASKAGVPITFVGAGPQENAMREACPHAIFAGWQDREGIAEYAKNARALVMPSVYPEPYGLVAVEALGSGLPVIVSDTALLAPEIVAAQAGWQVDVRDETRFASLLAEVCSDRYDIAQYSKNAIETAPQLGSSPEQWCTDLEGAFSSVDNTFS